MSGIGIAPEGQLLVVGLAAMALVLCLVAIATGRWPVWVAGYGLVVVALLVAFFFRDPDRIGERGPLVYLAPADGSVLEVARVDEPDYLGGGAMRITISPALVDVHVQRSPVDGVVDYVGADEEGTSMGINNGEVRVMVRQIAGLIARRIVIYVEEGQLVDQGERLGLIRIGSRVDTFLPADSDVRVGPGDRVRAGTTVLAYHTDDR